MYGNIKTNDSSLLQTLENGLYKCIMLLLDIYKHCNMISCVKLWFCIFCSPFIVIWNFNWWIKLVL